MYCVRVTRRTVYRVRAAGNTDSLRWAFTVHMDMLFLIGSEQGGWDVGGFRNNVAQIGGRGDFAP